MDDADLLRNRATRLFCASRAKPPRRLFRVRGRTGQFGARGRQARGNNRKAFPVAAAKVRDDCSAIHLTAGPQTRRERIMLQLFATAVGELQRTLSDAFNPYRPELHYMRGPGPACRAKAYYSSSLAK